MPIQDEEFDHDPIRSDSKDSSLNKMSSGSSSGSSNDLAHLKLATGGSKSDKGIDIRKGISIEKTIKMKTDDNTGSIMAKQEFDIIQHSQSNFEGVKGILLKNQKQNSAAI